MHVSSDFSQTPASQHWVVESDTQASHLRRNARLSTTRAAVKEEHLHDYAVRKDNIAAAEKAFWEEELGLHA